MYKKILVAVDGSDTSQLALEESVKIAKECASELRIIYVVYAFDVYPEVEYISAQDVQDSMRKEGKKILSSAKKYVEASGIHAEGSTIETDSGHPRIAEAIAAEATKWAAELIVVGTHGRRGFNHLLMGSVAESIVRVATKPVLLIRGGRD